MRFLTHSIQQRQAAVDPPTDRLGTETACIDCYCLHPPLLFSVTQHESWHLFYHHGESRRLCQPMRRHRRPTGL